MAMDKGQAYFIDHLHQKTTWKDPRPVNTPKKLKNKPPKYEVTPYSKIQAFLAKLHKNQDEGQLEIVVSRENLFVDGYAFFKDSEPSLLKRRLFVKFEKEDGLDYGGMSRELVLCLSQEFVKPERHLFVRSQDGYVFHITRNSDNMDHFNYFGRFLAFSVYHNKLITPRFNLVFYKHLLGKQLVFEDLKYIDGDAFNSFTKIKESNDINSWALNFEITEKNEDGAVKTVELKPGGSDLNVTNENKQEFLNLVMEYHFYNTKAQMEAIKTGFYGLISLEAIQHFDPEELELMLNGITDIDVNDLKANTEYGEGISEFTPGSFPSFFFPSYSIPFRRLFPNIPRRNCE
eukprot:TRINITY_DN6301_c0_g1_i2.p1 TRINITY_DN6301_c0_g1~~TRINITY_DN6301_c0_g1_i2.p1  ORF type:complete len:378 (-),score=83.91 TRINITY_DN6301_c0_g1_i2:323-1360(-)